MAFDEVQFPLHVSYGAKGGPRFSTDIVTVNGGYERRNQNWAQARRAYDASTGVHSSADAMLLSAFFYARAGRARGFRLRDWFDYSSAPDGISTPAAADQLIGSGDGSTTSFQLIKNYGSGSVVYAREVRKPVAGSVSIAVNGTAATSGWSVDTTTGLVSFSTAPASGASVSAGFLFDVPVRFDTDTLQVLSFEPEQTMASIPMIEVRV